MEHPFAIFQSVSLTSRSICNVHHCLPRQLSILPGLSRIQPSKSAVTVEKKWIWRWRYYKCVVNYKCMIEIRVPRFQFQPHAKRIKRSNSRFIFPVVNQPFIDLSCLTNSQPASWGKTGPRLLLLGLELWVLAVTIPHSYISLYFSLFFLLLFFKEI